MRWLDIGFLSHHENEFYVNTYGVIGIAHPKTRRMSAHAMHQYVTIESPILADFLRRVLSSIPPNAVNARVWPGGAHPLRMWWLRAIFQLGFLDMNLTWAGLRAGGATDYWLRTANPPALRRRLRHRSEHTLERYVQEAVFMQCSQRLPPRVSETLRRVSGLSGTLLREAPEHVLVPEGVDPTAADHSSSSSDESE